jgi:transcriptional regulator NrdR family protein
MARAHNCPDCGCTDTFRVHRRPKEYVLLGDRAFCCADCKRRYLIFEIGKLLQWRSTT